jgi:NADH-quinone oxidoreductase subunit C
MPLLTPQIEAIYQANFQSRWKVEGEAIRLDSDVQHLHEDITFLMKAPGLYFDQLLTITAFNASTKDSDTLFQLVYVLRSLVSLVTISVYLQVEKETAVDTITALFPSANWQEREVYDMFGIEFTNHPDMRRLFLPADWVGYPLLPEYEWPEAYHGIPLKHPEQVSGEVLKN